MAATQVDFVFKLSVSGLLSALPCAAIVACSPCTCIGVFGSVLWGGIALEWAQDVFEVFVERFTSLLNDWERFDYVRGSLQEGVQL